MKQEDIDNWFQYHAPTQIQIARYSMLRNAAKSLAELFDANVSDCADKTAAMRHLRETVMAMNLAIACNPGPVPETGNFITGQLISHGFASKEKVLARFPQAYVTISPNHPDMVQLYTNEADHWINATTEQAAWDQMAEVIERGNV